MVCVYDMVVGTTSCILEVRGQLYGVGSLFLPFPGAPTQVVEVARQEILPTEPSHETEWDASFCLMVLEASL